jgi:hypothetical protein
MDAKTSNALSRAVAWSMICKDRFFIYDIFVFLRDKSSSNIVTKEFRICNTPNTQRCCHDWFPAIRHFPSAYARYLVNQLMGMKRRKGYEIRAEADKQPLADLLKPDPAAAD